MPPVGPSTQLSSDGPLLPCFPRFTHPGDAEPPPHAPGGTGAPGAVEWNVKAAAGHDGAGTEDGGAGAANDARELLRRRGMRVTAIRVAVLEALGQSRTPLTAQELADQLADAKADRVTIYRTLNSLVESGLAHKVDPGDRVFRFGLTGVEKSAGHVGATPHQHPHFVCDECGNVECLEDTEIIVQRKTPAKNTGSTRDDSRKKMRLTANDVLLHGTCEECGDDENAARKDK